MRGVRGVRGEMERGEGRGRVWVWGAPARLGVEVDRRVEGDVDDGSLNLEPQPCVVRVGLARHRREIAEISPRWLRHSRGCLPRATPPGRSRRSPGCLSAVSRQSLGGLSASSCLPRPLLVDVLREPLSSQHLHLARVDLRRGERAASCARLPPPPRKPCRQRGPFGGRGRRAEAPEAAQRALLRVRGGMGRKSGAEVRARAPTAKSTARRAASRCRTPRRARQPHLLRAEAARRSAAGPR